MRDKHLVAILTLFVGTMLSAGCKDNTASFFSGRPSEMDMVHSRIIAGQPESMIELLRVPSRFPNATEAQISDWQGSVIAWWKHPEKQKLMVDSFGKISRYEMHELRVWVRVRAKLQTEFNSLTLSEIEAALKAVTPLP
ncbi:MAG: hypothetical protein HGA50_12985 [Deltaproteobacteria bacterium]|nr:hypothetical protein [Deltaproteobacteria bacterium]